MLHSFFIMKNDGHKVINLLLIAMLAGGSLFTDINIAEAKVGASMQGFVLSGAYSLVSNQPTGTGSFSNGAVGAYPEGSCVPALIQLNNPSEESDAIDFAVEYDYKHQGGGGSDVVAIDHLEVITSLIPDPATADNLNDFSFTDNNFETAGQFQSSNGAVSALVQGPYSGKNGDSPIQDSDAVRHYNVSLGNIPGQTTVHVLLCARLGVDASEIPGKSLSVKSSGGGGGSMPIDTNALLQLPSLTIEKQVADGNATPDQWTFDVSPAINGQSTYSITSGYSSVTIPNVSPDGEYLITENPGPDGYRFLSGQGTNCVFGNATATASLYAAKPAANAVCTFVNGSGPFTATTGTITIIKNVINDDQGEAQASDFNFTLDYLDANGATSTSFSGNGQGTTFTVEQGAYKVTEDADEGYATTYAGDCEGTITAGQNLTCTVTNNDLPIIPSDVATGTIRIIKNVVNDHGATSTAQDFTLTLSASGTNPINFTGNASGTEFVIPVGAYTVIEQTAAGYTAIYSEDCSGIMAAGSSTVCTVTNDDIDTSIATGTITIIKQVINDNEGQSSPEDFSLTLNASNTEPIIFNGNASGTSFVIEAGGYYEVTEDAYEDYTASYSEGCSGILEAGTTSTVCTVTNNDNYNEQPPSNRGKLIVIKKVVHSYSRPENASDFTLRATYMPAPNDDTAYAFAKVMDIVTSTTSVFRGNETGTEFEVGVGPYSVTEDANPYYNTAYSEGCRGNIVSDMTVTCTVTNTDKPSSGGGGGSSSGGGGGWSPGILGSTPAPTAVPQPTPRVLGAEDEEAPLCILTEAEALYVTSDVRTILGHLGVNRNEAMEEKYNKELTPRVVPADISPEHLAAIQNFVNYGTKSNVRLGQGERAGAVNSFRAIYKRVPANECDWQNVIKIADTKMPYDLSAGREEEVLKTFKEIYGYDYDSNNLLERIAHKVMSYGVRPQIRDLDAEYTAAKVFYRIYGKFPTTASEWDANRALAYSGIPQKWLTKDLTKNASLITNIGTNNTPISR